MSAGGAGSSVYFVSRYAHIAIQNEQISFGDEVNIGGGFEIIANLITGCRAETE